LVATAIYAVAAFGSEATRSPLLAVRSPIAVVVNPRVQTLETRVVARIDPKTHAREPALVLGTAKFRITVTNENRVALTGIRVTDPLSPGCSRTIGTLLPRASVGYVCSAARVGRNYKNVVSASGDWPKGARVLAGAQAAVKDTATAKVNVKPKTKVKHHAFFPAFTG
jgi:uncharacterized repeat protein (TIGR01451 family)